MKVRRSREQCASKWVINKLPSKWVINKVPPALVPEAKATALLENTYKVHVILII
jgi:hypothetical protein